MLLSDAIRAGSKLTGQAFWTVKELDGRTCALGAAAEGAGYRVGRCTTTGLAAAPWFHYNNHAVACPRPPSWEGRTIGDARLLDVVVFLNDMLQWTRERIADWVEEHEWRLGMRQKPVEPVVEAQALPPKPTLETLLASVEEPAALESLKPEKEREHALA